ncbi:MAG TPA: CBS domain-containing protein [Kofleriaceae bacterium]|nr:CBS domain-containing protein [Kofleriaceae bacterium]
MNAQEQESGTTPIAVRRIVDDAGETIEQSTGMSAVTAAVSTIMTRTVYCVQPEVGIDLLARLFLDYGVSGFPVVDAAGRPVGVVSKTDLLRYLHDQGLEVSEHATEDVDVLSQLGSGYHAVRVDSACVRELMMPIVFAVTADTPIGRAAALMAGENIHRLPVLDAEGAVCGILSTLDIVRWLANEAGYRVR